MAYLQRKKKLDVKMHSDVETSHHHQHKTAVKKLRTKLNVSTYIDPELLNVYQTSLCHVFLHCYSIRNYYLLS